MTRRIDWRRAATKAELRELLAIEENIELCELDLADLRPARKRLISKLYARARRAAKGGK